MQITPAQWIQALKDVAAVIDENANWLSELDGPIGDSDHGVTMSIGWRAVAKALDGLPDNSDLTTICNTAAKAFLNAVGASAGPLYATALMRGGAQLKGRSAIDLSGFVDFFRAARDGIRDRGKAEPGDKTMLDAWLPAVSALEEAQKADLPLIDALHQAAEAAAEGADKTKNMQARKGRSSRLGERSLGHMDPGAASTTLLFRAIEESLKKQV